jgi:nicotinamidase-related amidase
MPALDPATTALVLIDLQHGILALDTAPRPGDEILRKGRELAERFRSAGAPVVLVRVAFGPSFVDAPPGQVDRPLPHPPGGLPANWSTLAEELVHEGDLVVTKRQWGAFTGTELDMLLRRRGVSTVVVAGIATNLGVESTVRHAWELGYNVVVAEDACTSLSAELHAMSVEHILPRIARVVPMAEVVLGPAN